MADIKRDDRRLAKSLKRGRQDGWSDFYEVYAEMIAMNHPVDRIAKCESPSLSNGFREGLEMRVQPMLASRRRKRRITTTLIWGSVCVLIICLQPVLSSLNDESGLQGSIGEGPGPKPSAAVAVTHSLDELLEKHFAAPFGTNPLRDELEQALAGLSAEELLEIGRKYAASNVHKAASHVAPDRLGRVAERSDCIVHVHVEGAQLDVQELQRVILRNQLSRHRESWGRLLVNFDLSVRDSHPELPTEVGDRLKFWAFVGYNERDKIHSGGEYFLSLRYQWGRYRLSHGAYGGVYPISTDADGATIVTIDGEKHRFEKARELITAAYEAANNPKPEGGPPEPTPEELADWLRKLSDGNLGESAKALKFLKGHPKAIPPTLLVDAIERHYRAFSARVGDDLKLPRDSATRVFIEDAVDLLPQIIDEENVKRLLALYKADLAEYDALLDGYLATRRITRLALAVPGPGRSGRFRELYFGRTPPKFYRFSNAHKKKISRPLAAHMAPCVERELRYLNSPRTEALLEERARSGGDDPS